MGRGKWLCITIRHVTPTLWPRARGTARHRVLGWTLTKSRQRYVSVAPLGFSAIPPIVRVTALGRLPTRVSAG